MTDQPYTWIPFDGPPAPLPPWPDPSTLPPPPMPPWQSACPRKTPIPDLTPRRAAVLNRSDRAPLSLEGPDPEWDACVNPTEACSLDDANIITSEVIGQPGIHKFAIDVDLPVMAVPSTQPGHWHLYIDKQIEWSTYVKLLTALAEAGIIEVGYARASITRGYTSLRPPWVPKTTDEMNGSSC